MVYFPTPKESDKKSTFFRILFYLNHFSQQILKKSDCYLFYIVSERADFRMDFATFFNKIYNLFFKCHYDSVLWGWGFFSLIWYTYHLWTTTSLSHILTSTIFFELDHWRGCKQRTVDQKAGTAIGISAPLFSASLQDSGLQPMR